MRFLLVDRILECVPGERITGVKNVAMSEDALEFHFPGNPVMPGMLLTEALVQLAGWLEAAGSDFRRWFLLDAMHRSAFYGFALPGDRVDLQVELLSSEGDRRRLRGSGCVEGKRKVETEFEGVVVPLAELEDPDVQRCFFDRLTRREVKG